MPEPSRHAPLPPLSLRHSRGLRWGAIFAAVLGTSLLAMFGLMYWRSSFLLFETLDRSVLEQLELLSARPPDMLPFMITSRMNHQPAVLTQVGLFDPAGVPIVGEIASIPAGLIPDGRIRAVRAPEGFGRYWRAAARRLGDGRILLAARSSDEIREVRSDLVHGAAFGIVPAILLSLGGGAIIGIATERRLRRINAVAERVIAGDLAARLPGAEVGDELDRLCVTVNRMLDRNEANVTALSNAGDNIAHDLRTPLTGLRSRLERLQRTAGDGLAADAIGACMNDVDRSLSIIRALLRVADIRHARRTSDFEPVDLGALLREIAEDFSPLAEDKGVRLSTRIDGEGSVLGDRQLLAEAIINLVDNAIKFTGAGDAVELALTLEAGVPAVVVSDTGPGIRAEEHSLVFRRFYRGDGSRSTQGSGLGLSLAAEIAALHGFGLDVTDNAPGCRFKLACHKMTRSGSTRIAGGPHLSSWASPQPPVAV